LIRYIFALVIALLCVPAFAQSLPEDGEKYSIVIVDSPYGTPQGSALVKSLKESPEMQRIIMASNFQQFATNSPLFRERFGATIDATQVPVFAYCRADGGVLYKATGAAIPAMKELAEELTHRATVDRDLVRTDGVEFNTPPAVQNPTSAPVPERILPRLIPDSISVQPTIQFDGSQFIVPALIALIALLGFGGLGVVAIGAAVWYFSS
jgi:hypothetical protein